MTSIPQAAAPVQWTLAHENLRLSRLEFAKYLVATGDVTDMDGAEWCAACGTPLVYLPGHLVVLLQAGLPANPIRCRCGTLTIPSEGGRLVPPHGEAA